jgi:hypothetical protein
MPLLRIPRHLNIKVQYQPCYDQLDFIGRKEAPGTCVSSVSKCEIRLVGSNELVACMVRCRPALTQLVVSEAVKRGAVRVVF